jgi:hypothetical protein
MPSPVGTVITLMTKAWPLLVTYGPRVLTAFTVVSKFAADNPLIPKWFRERLEHLPNRLNEVQKRHGDAAKIRGTLDIIRDVARDAQTANEPVDAALYVSRADRIERGVKLAETRDRQEQKPLLGKLKADTDALLADVLEAVSGTSTGTAAAAPDAAAEAPLGGAEATLAADAPAHVAPEVPDTTAETPGGTPQESDRPQV